MMPGLTYADCEATELRRQGLLAEATRTRLSPNGAAGRPRALNGTLRRQIGSLLVRAGEALQGTLVAESAVPCEGPALGAIR